MVTDQWGQIQVVTDQGRQIQVVTDQREQIQVVTGGYCSRGTDTCGY